MEGGEQRAAGWTPEGFPDVDAGDGNAGGEKLGDQPDLFFARIFFQGRRIPDPRARRGGGGAGRGGDEEGRAAGDGEGLAGQREFFLGGEGDREGENERKREGEKERENGLHEKEGIRALPWRGRPGRRV